jgi:hypothetical protein
MRCDLCLGGPRSGTLGRGQAGRGEISKLAGLGVLREDSFAIIVISRRLAVGYPRKHPQEPTIRRPEPIDVPHRRSLRQRLR